MRSDQIHLVLGVSSAGKSTYIKFKQDKEDWQDIPVLMAYEVGSDSSADILKQECIVHYNLFRSYNNDVVNIENELLEDKVLSCLLKYRDRIKGYLLVIDPTVTSKRILLRTETEPLLMGHTHSYPQQKIFELFSYLDMNEFHQKWIALLKEFQIDFKILNSETQEYIRMSHDSLTTFFHAGQNGLPTNIS